MNPIEFIEMYDNLIKSDSWYVYNEGFIIKPRCVYNKPEYGCIDIIFMKLEDKIHGYKSMISYEALDYITFREATPEDIMMEML